MAQARQTARGRYAVWRVGQEEFFGHPVFAPARRVLRRERLKERVATGFAGLLGGYSSSGSHALSNRSITDGRFACRVRSSYRAANAVMSSSRWATHAGPAGTVRASAQGFFACALPTGA